MEEQTNGDDGALLPVKPEGGCDCFSVKKLCPWGIVLLVLLFIAGAWLWLGGGSKDPVYSFVPATAYKVDTFNRDGRALAHLAALPLWQKPEQAAEIIRTGFLGMEFPELKTSEKWQEVLPLVTTATKAFTAEGTLHILTSGNAWQIERIITENIANDYNRERDSMDILGIKIVRKLKIAGIGNVFLTRINQTVLLTRSEGLMRSAIACHRGQEDSLGGIGLSLPQDDGGRLVFCRYEVPAVANSFFTGVGEGNFRKDAALYSAWSAEGDGFAMRCRIINNAAITAASGHGIFYYIGMTVLVVLILVIGLPIVFIMIVLLMAMFFHVMAWWRGELVPVEPAELPELSPQMKEDIGAEATGDKPGNSDADKAGNEADGAKSE